MGNDDVFRHKHLFIYHKFWDFNGDGVITFDDFYLMAEKYAIHQRRGKYEQDVVDKWLAIVKKWWQSLAEHADENKDGVVDFEEWLRYFDKLGKTTKKHSDLPEFLQNVLRLYFFTIDFNKDGLFDIKDYRIYLAVYNMDVRRADECYNHMLTLEDRMDNAGVLTHERFNDLVYDYWISKDPKSHGKYICGPFDSTTVEEMETKLEARK